MFRRVKVAAALLGVAVGLAVAGYFIYSKDAQWRTYFGVVCYALAGCVMAMGFGVLLWGRIKITGVLAIDVKQTPPEFRIGPMFFNVAISANWRRGAVRLKPLDLFLIIPLAVRLFVVVLLAFSVYRLMKVVVPERPLWAAAAAGGSAVVFFLLQMRIKSPQPEKQKAGK